jgi:hypothetical protein
MATHRAKHSGVSNTGSMQGVTFEPGDNDDDTGRGSSSGGGITNSGVMHNVVVTSGDNNVATNTETTVYRRR